jgi:hypothetical protein
MSRYIDVEPLEKALKMNVNGFKHQGSEFAKGFDAAIATMKGILQELPTADVVAVVRCKDCKHCEQYPLYKEKGKESKLEYTCCVFGNVNPDFYCGIGERREK